MGNYIVCNTCFEQKKTPCLYSKNGSIDQLWPHLQQNHELVELKDYKEITETATQLSVSMGKAFSLTNRLCEEANKELRKEIQTATKQIFEKMNQFQLEILEQNQKRESSEIKNQNPPLGDAAQQSEAIQNQEIRDAQMEIEKEVEIISSSCNTNQKNENNDQLDPDQNKQRKKVILKEQNSPRLSESNSQQTYQAGPFKIDHIDRKRCPQSPQYPQRSKGESLLGKRKNKNVPPSTPQPHKPEQGSSKKTCIGPQLANRVSDMITFVMILPIGNMFLMQKGDKKLGLYRYKLKKATKLQEICEKNQLLWGRYINKGTDQCDLILLFENCLKQYSLKKLNKYVLKEESIVDTFSTNKINKFQIQLLYSLDDTPIAYYIVENTLYQYSPMTSTTLIWKFKCRSITCLYVHEVFGQTLIYFGDESGSIHLYNLTAKTLTEDCLQVEDKQSIKQMFIVASKNQTKALVILTQQFRLYLFDINAHQFLTTHGIKLKELFIDTTQKVPDCFYGVAGGCCYSFCIDSGNLVTQHTYKFEQSLGSVMRIHRDKWEDQVQIFSGEDWIYFDIAQKKVKAQ